MEIKFGLVDYVKGAESMQLTRAEFEPLKLRELIALLLSILISNER